MAWSVELWMNRRMYLDSTLHHGMSKRFVLSIQVNTPSYLYRFSLALSKSFLF